MIIFGVIVGIGILGGMVYLVLNKKSTGTVRLAGIIAIALMLITLIICLIIIFTGRREVAIDYSNYIVGSPVEETKPSSGNFVILTLLILIIIALFIFIINQSRKEIKKIKE